MALDLLALEAGTPANDPDDLLLTAKRGISSSTDLVTEAARVLSKPDRPVAHLSRLMERLAKLSEGITKQQSLEETLRDFSNVMEEHLPETKVVIMLCLDGKQLTLGAAPSMPDSFRSALNELLLTDDGVGCVEAALKVRRTYSENIVDNPLWGDRQETAKAEGLHSCLSQPVVDQQNGSVLAVIDIYGQAGWLPTTAVVLLVEGYQRLAGLAIRSNLLKKSLVEQEGRYRDLFEHSVAGTAVIDGTSTIIQANLALAKITGLPKVELVGLTMEELFETEVFESEMDNADTANSDITHSASKSTIDLTLDRRHDASDLSVRRLRNRLADQSVAVSVNIVSLPAYGGVGFRSVQILNLETLEHLRLNDGES